MFVIVFVIIINVIGQLLMKMGMNTLAPLNFKNSIFKEGLRIFSNKYVIFGIITYVAGTFLWLYVLSKMELSISYPMLSISYILIAFFSWLFIGEPITITKIIGIALIGSGVFFLLKT